MNVVFILSDQHNARFSGCYGHPLAETPHIDRIARQGVRFAQAWCASPLCVPSRASLFTGRYTFEHGCWDNCIAWDGRLAGWPQALKASGVHLTTIGKLDFAAGHDHGIAQELLGGHRSSRDIHSLFRTEADLPPRWQEHEILQQAGPRAGMTLQSTGGWKVLERTRAWLAQDRLTLADRPWVLNVNFLEPHPGWPCPPALWEKWKGRVKLDQIPPMYFEAVEKLHPVNQAYAHHSTGQYTTREEVWAGFVAYLAHCEIIDTLVGEVLAELERQKILDETLVIYTSDHGENCHAHGLWGKMNLYEEALRVPLCAMGPGIPAGRVEHAPASLLDIFPTCFAAAATTTAAAQAPAEPPPYLRGISLLPQMQAHPNAPRNEFVFSEYHANGASTGSFAICDGRYKLLEYPGHRPALFDLHNDPDELHDRVLYAPHAQETKQALSRLRARLNQLCSPAAVDLRAKNDQAALRTEMERDGSLAKELLARGYQPRVDKMVPRAEMIPERFRGDGRF